MKRHVFWMFCLTAALVFPWRLWAGAAQDTGDTARAFQEAGIPVPKERIASVDFSLPRPGGGNLSLTSFKGKVVFLNFWATWCGPCRMEMPSMEALYRRFKDRGFEILAVNCQEDEADVAAFLEQYGLSFPVALDPGAAAARYGIRAFPTTFIIDREGMIAARVVGAIDWDTPKIAAAFDALLGD